MESTDNQNGLNQQEEKDLRRVFDHLAGYVHRRNLTRTIQPKIDRQVGLLAYKKSPDTTEVPVADGRQMSMADVESEAQTLTVDIFSIRQQLKQLAENPQKKISVRDLDQALRALGKTCSRKELEVSLFVRCGEWG
jgi:hypothetical protein